MPRFCTNRFKKSFISVMCGRVGLCVISLFFFFSVILVLSLFLVKKIVISLLPLFFTFYSIVNNSEIQPAGCNLIILLNLSIHPSIHPSIQPASQPASHLYWEKWRLQWIDKMLLQSSWIEAPQDWGYHPLRSIKFLTFYSASFSDC